MAYLNLSSVDLITILAELEATGHPSDGDLIKRLRAASGGLTEDRLMYLRGLLDNSVIENSGLLNVLGSIGKTLPADDLGQLVVDVVDALHLLDAGLLD
jgi:hypothetical protein